MTKIIKKEISLVNDLQVRNLSAFLNKEKGSLKYSNMATLKNFLLPVMVIRLLKTDKV